MDLLLNHSECLEILNKLYGENNYNLIDYRIENASANTIGFLGDYYKLITDINDENNNLLTLKFFIKSLPQNNPQQRQQFIETGIFSKEAQIYQLLEKFNENHRKLNQWRPNCYYTRSDIIVLEDLMELNYIQISDEQISSNLHIQAVLTALAEMHALSIAYEVKNSININTEYGESLFETSVSPAIDWCHVGIQAVKTILVHHPNYQSAEYQNFIENEFIEKIQPVYEMVNSSLQFRNVLCHRDAWGRNILFKQQTDDNDDLNCALVDFQTCRYCPPAIDILFFIYLNTQRSFRQLIYTQSIQWYHNQLDKQLKTLLNTNQYEMNRISLNELIESCELLKLSAILYNCIAGTVIKLPNGFLNNLKHQEPDLYFQFGNVTRNDYMVKFLNENHKFQEFMFEATAELMEIIYE